jgi:hypothetical protein
MDDVRLKSSLLGFIGKKFGHFFFAHPELQA